MLFLSTFCWVALGLIALACWVGVIAWINESLFITVGEVEISPNRVEEIFAYELLTVPARIVACIIGVAATYAVAWFCIFILQTIVRF